MSLFCMLMETIYPTVRKGSYRQGSKILEKLRGAEIQSTVLSVGLRTGIVHFNQKKGRLYGYRCRRVDLFGGNKKSTSLLITFIFQKKGGSLVKY